MVMSWWVDHPWRSPPRFSPFFRSFAKLAVAGSGAFSVSTETLCLEFKTAPRNRYSGIKLLNVFYSLGNLVKKSSRKV